MHRNHGKRLLGSCVYVAGKTCTVQSKRYSGFYGMLFYISLEKILVLLINMWYDKDSYMFALEEYSLKTKFDRQRLGSVSGLLKSMGDVYHSPPGEP